MLSQVWWPTLGVLANAMDKAGESLEHRRSRLSLDNTEKKKAKNMFKKFFKKCIVLKGKLPKLPKGYV